MDSCFVKSETRGENFFSFYLIEFRVDWYFLKYVHENIFRFAALCCSHFQWVLLRPLYRQCRAKLGRKFIFNFANSALSIFYMLFAFAQENRQCRDKGRPKIYFANSALSIFYMLRLSRKTHTQDYLLFADIFKLNNNKQSAVCIRCIIWWFTIHDCTSFTKKWETTKRMNNKCDSHPTQPIYLQFSNQQSVTSYESNGWVPNH